MEEAGRGGKGVGKGRGFADVTNLPKFLLIHIWYMKFASNGKGVAGICPSPCHSAGFERAQGKNNLTVDAFFLLVAFERKDGII